MVELLLSGGEVQKSEGVIICFGEVWGFWGGGGGMGGEFGSGEFGCGLWALGSGLWGLGTGDWGLGSVWALDWDWVVSFRLLTFREMRSMDPWSPSRMAGMAGNRP